MTTATHSWTFLTNHTHVLLTISRQLDMRVRDIATQVGITERAVIRIIHELEAAGFIYIEREGRQNRYKVHTDRNLRHPLEKHHTVGELLQAIAGEVQVDS